MDQDRPVFIHEKMSTAGARSYFLSSSRYSIVPDRPIRTLTQSLTLFMENTMLLFLGSLDVVHRNLLLLNDFPAPP